MKTSSLLEPIRRLRTVRRKVGRIQRELLWVAVGQAMAAVGGLVGVRIMSGLLSPTAYGELALVMTVGLLVNQSMFGPLANGISRFYAPAVESNDLNRYFHASLMLSLGATGLVFLAALILGSGALLSGNGCRIPLGLAALSFATLLGFNLLLNSIQNAARQRAIVALHQGIDSWTRFACAATMIMLLGANATVAVLGYTVAISMVLVSQYLFFRKIMRTANCSIPAPGAANWLRRIYQYSWPFSTWGLFTWAQMSSDRWALGVFDSVRDVGLYAALFQLGSSPIAMASTMALQLLTPIFYQRAGDGKDGTRNINVGKLGRRLTLLALTLTALVTFGALLLHRQIFQLLVADKYSSVSYLLPYMLFGSGIFAASQLIELTLMSQMKTRVLLVAKIAAALLGIGLNFAGAWLYGVAGVVAAGVATSSVYCLWMVHLSRSLTAHHTETN